MFDVRKPTKEDYKKFAPALRFARQNDNADNGYYMIVENGGVQKLLQVIGKKCYLFSLLYDNEVASTEFLLDDEFNLDFVAISEDYVVSVEKDEEDNVEYVFVNNHNGNPEEFSFSPRPNNPDPDGYDGYVTYVQYDEKKDTRLMMIYQHMIKAQNRLYEYHLKQPKFVIIDRKASTDKPKRERYAKRDFNYVTNPMSYTLATMKEHGFLKTINEGAVNINMMADFSRYYRIVRETETEIKIAFPFGSQYTTEEIKGYINKLGFNADIPKEIIDFTNGDNKDFKEILMISEFFRQMYEYSKGAVRLVLEKEDHDGNS